MAQMSQESQASNKMKTLKEIVDTFMKASDRSDYHPKKGYRPPAIGKSSRKQTMVDELRAIVQEERSLREQQAQEVIKHQTYNSLSI